MIVYYLQIKWVHVFAVLASGLLFATRGAFMLAGARWPMAAPLRYFSYSVDTVLVTAAAMLLTILPAAMFANGWLTAKLLLLLVYIVLGSFALKRARTERGRAVSYCAALVVFACMLGIARAHHPLGLLLYALH
ncbi:hypothetical protein BH11PSE14_BH11PSE14_18860 [soil metagenome]